ncbi:uncharacterized protein K441DRAFT_682617 [Cenococcum geophilum 1.58]|uniref:Uncharacterized protein n=1 Tax=Cenococcum geophilum 1.58 TaxID=794803 RepID=A0ACC8EP92_9PEZI|nr:hypothetical protein K441DRAFT_682617 [Cenococcum geophilum 1.58]
MSTQGSAHSLFERARLRGSERNKDLLVNGEEVKKELQPSTKGNYTRALALWQEYEIRHPGSTPTSIEASKDFVRIVAPGIGGKYEDADACLSSVVQTYKNFTAGWRWAGHEKIDRVTLSASNFIKYPLQDELQLARRKRVRRYGTIIHFLCLGTQLRQND